MTILSTPRRTMLELNLAAFKHIKDFDHILIHIKYRDNKMFILNVEKRINVKSMERDEFTITPTTRFIQECHRDRELEKQYIECQCSKIEMFLIGKLRTNLTDDEKSKSSLNQ
jgi:hypothetical protein